VRHSGDEKLTDLDTRVEILEILGEGEGRGGGRKRETMKGGKFNWKELGSSMELLTNAKKETQ